MYCIGAPVLAVCKTSCVEATLDGGGGRTKSYPDTTHFSEIDKVGGLRVTSMSMVSQIGSTLIRRTLSRRRGRPLCPWTLAPSALAARFAAPDSTLLDSRRASKFSLAF